MGPLRILRLFTAKMKTNKSKQQLLILEVKRKTLHLINLACVSPTGRLTLQIRQFVVKMCYQAVGKTSKDGP